MRCKLLGVLTLLVMSIPSLVYGQATIAGTVEDASGAVLPGVTVEAASPALIEKVRSTNTDGTGQYRLENLRPGLYRVTFTLPGFATVVRDGVELAGTFTATINADLRVGAVEETVTVTGESPTVDVQNTTRQRVLNAEVIDALPTWRSDRNLALLIPAVMAHNAGSSSAPDVGGSRDLTVSTLRVHGSRAQDQKHTVMGLSLGGGDAGGSNGRYVPNMAAMQEVTVDVAAVDAEQSTGGVRINMIPKDGGNRFTGSMFWGYGSEAMQGNNLTPELEAALGTPEALKSRWDFNPGGGGPIKRDRIWFFVGYKHIGSETYPAGVFNNLNANNPNAWTYEPDLSSRPFNTVKQRDAQARLTWQVTSKLKTGWTLQDGMYCGCPNTITPTRAPDAVFLSKSRKIVNWIGDWSMPMTNRLLLDGGVLRRHQNTGQNVRPDLNPAMISVTEQSLGNFVYRAPETVPPGGGNNPTPAEGPFNKVWYLRSAVSYVAGGHAVRAGGNLRWFGDAITFGSVQPMMFRFNRGIPNQLTLFGTPVRQEKKADADHGLFVQDKWTVGRLTASYGVRYDVYKLSFPAVTLGPTALLPNRNFSFPDTPGVSWHDWTPKSGLAYDVFGNGKTALKVSLNKYVEGMGTQGFFGNVLAPSQRLSNQTTRSWNDANRDFVPDCDLVNPVANGECGASTNANFGLAVSGNTYDPSVLTGWGRRPYNWEFSAGVQQELLARVAVDVSFFRRSFGNFYVEDNRAVGPEDFGTFSIVVPNTDSRLPTAGQTLTGYYDLNPNKVGQVDNYITNASHYGDQSESWVGVDVSLTARPRNGLLLQGGTSTGRLSTNTCAVRSALPETAPTNPFCDATGPFQTNLKVLAAYTVPRIDVQIAGTLQNLAGYLANATFVASNALVAPSLGRPLSGNAANVTVPLIEPSSLFGDRTTSVDVRVGKVVRVKGIRAALNLDMYNILNSNTVVTALNTFGGARPWLSPQSVMQPRLLMVSTQFDF